MSGDEQPDPEAGRDQRGRFVKGISGNPRGKAAGIMNDATRTAASLLTASAPVLVSKAIELALLGKSWPLKFCLDRIIAPQKDQPVLLEALSEGDGPGRAADFTAMMAAIASAAAEGSINPSQAATLCHAFAERARALETQERVDVQRGAVDAPAIWNRMQLRACVAIADGVREICEEGGEVDNQVPPLCLLIIRLGRMALLQLAKIDDHAEQILAAEAFVVEHPMPEDHPRHPIAAEMAPLWRKLDEYLNVRMYWLEEQIEERFLARQAAGEPDPIYRAWIFQPLEVRAARFVKPT